MGTFYVNVQLATLLQMIQGLVATLWQICYKMSNDIGKPLSNSSEGFGNVCKWLILVSLQQGCPRPYT
jgi:hypothetical protein